jgi:hypothetical protein
MMENLFNKAFNVTFNIDLNDSNLTMFDYFNDSDEFTGHYSKFFIILIVLYSTLILISLISNPILLIVLLWRRKSQLKFIDVFVSNLSLSDLFLTIFNIPLLMTMLFSGKLPFGSLICKLGIYSTSCNIYINLLTMAYISIDRYFAITKPVVSTKSQLRTRAPNYDYSTRRKMYLALTIIWLVALTVSVPQYLFTKLKSYSKFGEGIVNQCQHDFPFNLNRHMLMVNFAAQYLIPSLVILYFNGKIIYHLYSNLDPSNLFETQEDDNVEQQPVKKKRFIFWKLVHLFSDKHRRIKTASTLRAEGLTRTKNLKKSMKIMLIIIVLFLLSWMPIWIYRILTTFYPLFNTIDTKPINSTIYFSNCTLDNFIECLPPISSKHKKTYHSLYVYFVCHFLSMLSVCYNPIVYFWMHKKFRLEVKKMFKFTRKKSSNFDDEKRDNLTRLSGHKFNGKNSSFTLSTSKM